MTNLLFEIEPVNPNKFCRTCIHAQRTGFAHSDKIFYYCGKRKSNYTSNGKLKIKLKNPACNGFEEQK